ncbi:MAG: DUF2164 domain-containing protein [Patescibacteria group bacterium]
MMKGNELSLNREKRAEIISSIKDFFQRERDDEVGDLGAGLILDFFIAEIAPEFYNQGVGDAYKYADEHLEDVLSLQKL